MRRPVGLPPRAPVAQWIERRPPEPKVAGSNPVGRASSETQVVMRLEPLCRITMRYRDASWHRPYGAADAGSEALGFGSGDGDVTGEIDGRVAWANFPRLRQDGVWTPNLRGVIRTTDGSELLVSIHGQSIEERAPGSPRAILARVELTTEAERWRWLNTSFLAAEGEIDEARDAWWLETYVCVNQVARGEPALGEEPPERFRQRGRGA